MKLVFLQKSQNGNEKKSYFIGMKNFGSSGPAEDLYKNFNITAEAIVSKVKYALENN